MRSNKIAEALKHLDNVIATDPKQLIQTIGEILQLIGMFLQLFKTFHPLGGCKLIAFRSMPFLVVIYQN